MTLFCPDSRHALTPATAELLARLDARRVAGILRNFAGEIPDPFEAGFVTTDGAIFYPICAGIPVVLSGEGMNGEG